MNATQLALVVLITKALKDHGYRYLAEVKNGEIVVRIFKGLDAA